MDGERYFDRVDEHLRAGRGVAVYGAGEKQAADFAGRVRRAGITGRWVRLSEVAQGRPLPEGASGEMAPCLVHQDLPVAALEVVIHELVSRLVYPCYARRRSVLFLSGPSRDQYRDRVRADQMHADSRQVVGCLLVEQLADLVEDRRFDRPLPRAAAGGRRGEGAVPRLPVDPNLDANQQRAATHREGPIRVLAPAGSGKTKTLINRIAHLVNAGVCPDRILALAFNRKAAAEMRERLAAIGAPVSDRLDRAGVVVRTFHSLGYEVVRQHLGWRLAEEPGQGQARRHLRQAAAELYPGARPGPGGGDGLVEALTRVRMELPALATVEVRYGGRPVPFAPIFARYRQLQAQHRCVDYDDLVYLPLRALLDGHALRRRLQSRFEYLLVDEFQDLNRAQMLLLQILALPQNNLFAVGDDDQMIYGWRGAEVRHILDFAATFAAAADCLLATNYRSGGRIVQHARWLIDHNRERVPKDFGPRPGVRAGTFEMRLGRTLWDQAGAAAAWMVRERAARGVAWGDFAVLYRYRAYQFAVALALDRARIPHAAVDEGRLFRSRVGRDLRSYLRVLLKGESAGAADFGAVLTRPGHGLPQALVRRVTDWGRFVHASEMDGLQPWQAERLRRAVETVLQVRERLADGTAAAAAVTAIADELGLRRLYPRPELSPAGPDGMAGGILLEALEGTAAGYGTAGQLLAQMEAAGATGGGEDPAPGEGVAQGPADAVALSTIHRTKGNEYANVVYFNLQALGRARPEEVEEERRVAYVAATRAIDSLLVTAPVGSVSPFAAELALNPALAGRRTAALVARLWWRRWCRRWARSGADRHPAGPRPPAADPIEELGAEIHFRRQLRKARR